MVLAVCHLTKSYGINLVLHDISFAIKPGDRVGIVGMNGIGKTTLLRILTGEEPYDAGEVIRAPNVQLGYLPQQMPDYQGQSIADCIATAVGDLRMLGVRLQALEEAMATTAPDAIDDLLEEYGAVATRFTDLGGYELDHRIDAVLAGLGIAYLSHTRPMTTLSGGERARVGLAMLLLRAPDVLLLDEPTNDLDGKALVWLEEYIAQYRGAVALVSHDRRFLNRTVNHLFEIDEYTHQLRHYQGNYDYFLAAKAAERVRWEEDYQRRQKEIKDLQRRIRETGRQVAHNRRPADGDKLAYNAKGENVARAIARNVHAAEELLRQLEADPIECPPRPLRFRPHLESERVQATMVLNAAQVTKRVGMRTIIHDLDWEIANDARIMITGPNGAGKTTLLRILLGMAPPDSGVVRIGTRLRIGYLPQTTLFADPTPTVQDIFTEHLEGNEVNPWGGLLGNGLFRLEDISKAVQQLSAGQQRKLEIACLIADRPNMLVLDEPTNALSFDVIEAFEAAILAFAGPVIAVSHDRWFIERFGGEVWHLDEGGFVRVS